MTVGNTRRRARGTASALACGVVSASTSADGASIETSNGCAGTAIDPCTRSGSCEIQGSAWSQDVVIDRADIFDTQGWPGICDMVHVGLVQGDCEPPGSRTDVIVHLSPSTYAQVPSITGPLLCAGEPTPTPVPALHAVGIVVLGLSLALAALMRMRKSSRSLSA